MRRLRTEEKTRIRVGAWAQKIYLNQLVSVRQRECCCLQKTKVLLETPTRDEENPAEVPEAGGIVQETDACEVSEADAEPAQSEEAPTNSDDQQEVKTSSI